MMVFFCKKPIFLVKRKQINLLAYGLVNVFCVLGLVSLQVLPFLPLPIFPAKYLVSFDSDGRVLSVLIQLGNSTFNVVNIYSPDAVSDRKTFFERLHNYFLSSVLIIGGNFNCVDSPLDKFHSNDVHSIDKSSLCSLKSAFSLVDVWRKHHRCVALFIWSNSNNTQASRLDRFFSSKSLFGRDG